MNQYINCIAHKTSEGNLLLGENYTAMFDCGMALCADATIQNVKNALRGSPKGRQLDYLFITHTHYDHIGSLPFFRKEWPLLRLVTSQTGAAVLLKDTPRRVIRELSIAAAVERNMKFDTSYSDDAFHADVIVKEGDIISLGGLSVVTLETPGHTRDTLSFFIPELEMLIASETTGVLLHDGTVYPPYLTSFKDTISSIEKCRNMPYKFLSLPHMGLAQEKDANGFFDKAQEAGTACRDFIMSMNEKKLDEDAMLDMFTQEYGNETLFSYQPKDAFIANARATIACTLREFAPNDVDAAQQ
ncbi:MAG: MBL fold metallo-hydrolase [Treponema sp.]|jgi:glyoxylase-like metal-dependent hydrolase (beta-lactamase superfamily II)|nr:MBL fold metallo-hydrolase [Treponema sp.]